MNKKLFLLTSIAILILIILAIFFKHSLKSYIEKIPKDSFTNKTSTEKQKKIKIKEVEIEVELAITSQEKTKGLSGRKKLGKNEGMLFVFEAKTYPSFWMKNMLIPIDIIWIDDGKIVHIEKNVPNPQENTPDTDLTIYKPPVKINYVLEVTAEFAEKNQIKVGDYVDLSEL